MGSCIAAGNPLTHYVIVRADLPLGTMAAMLIHAAGESSPGQLPEDTHAIALVMPDEAALHTLELRLKHAGVAHAAIREPDAPWCGQLMAIGVVPGRRDALRRHLSSLPLLSSARVAQRLSSQSNDLAGCEFESRRALQRNGEVAKRPGRDDPREVAHGGSTPSLPTNSGVAQR